MTRGRKSRSLLMVTLVLAASSSSLVASGDSVTENEHHGGAVAGSDPFYDLSGADLRTRRDLYEVSKEIKVLGDSIKWPDGANIQTDKSSGGQMGEAVSHDGARRLRKRRKPRPRPRRGKGGGGKKGSGSNSISSDSESKSKKEGGKKGGKGGKKGGKGKGGETYAPTTSVGPSYMPSPKPTTTPKDPTSPKDPPTLPPSTMQPTLIPTEIPTGQPTDVPTTMNPSSAPVDDKNPPVAATTEPSFSPSVMPVTSAPSSEPPTSVAPTAPFPDMSGLVRCVNSATLSCPDPDLPLHCDKYNPLSSFKQCYADCIDAFCCIHDSTATRSKSCSKEPNCQFYHPCYIVWWKLHDTIGPAPWLRLQQDETFYDVNDDEFRQELVDNPDFKNQFYGHHFMDDDLPLTEETFRNEDNWDPAAEGT